MTVLALPAGVVPRSATWSLEHNVGVYSGPLGNTAQRVQRDGGRWRADVTFPTLTQEQGGLLAAYLDKAARGDMWTYLTPPHNDARGNWGPDELVANGGFTGGVVGWSAGAGAALNVNARRLRVKVGGSPGTVATAHQIITTEADQPHVVMVDLVGGSASDWRIRLLAGATEEHVSYYEDDGRVVFTHIPGSASTTLELACNSTTEQDYCYVANVSAARCLLVNDSLAVGNECDVKGGPAGLNGAILAGEFVTIQLWNGWQMVRLTEDLDTDSSGNGTLRFEPALRDGVRGGGAVVVHKPFVRMFVPEHASPHAVGLPRLYSGFSISYLEDVTEIGITENPQDTDIIWHWDAHSLSGAPQIGSGTPTYLSLSPQAYFDGTGVLKTTELDPDATGSPTTHKRVFEFDPITKALKGQRIQADRTNLALHSEDLTNAAWAKTDSTITANQAVAPDGTTTMDLVTEGTAGDALLTQSYTATANTNQVHFKFVRRGNNDWFFMDIREIGAGNRVDAWFNLRTGVVGSVANVGTATDAMNFMFDVGNGVFLCIVMGKVNNGATALRVESRCVTQNAAITTVNNATRYEWGAQIENNVPFWSSYIKTTTAAATRSPDKDTLATNLIPGFSETEFTLVAEFVRSVTGVLSGAAAVGGSLSDRAAIGRRLTTGAVLFVSSGGVTQANITTPEFTSATPSRIAGGFKANDFVCSTDGQAVSTDVSGSMPASITALAKGSTVPEGDSELLWGYLRRLTLLKTKKPNRQIRSLSA